MRSSDAVNENDPNSAICRQIAKRRHPFPEASLPYGERACIIDTFIHLLKGKGVGAGAFPPLGSSPMGGTMAASEEAAMPKS
jgi:hypothetical protein